MKHPTTLQPLQLFLLTAGNKYLAATDTVKNKGLPFRVQLRQHVVQQQDWPFSCLLLKDLPLGQLQG